MLLEEKEEKRKEEELTYPHYIHIHIHIHLQCDILVSCPIRQTFILTSIVGVCPSFFALVFKVHIYNIYIIYLRGTLHIYVRDNPGVCVRVRRFCVMKQEKREKCKKKKH